MKTKTALSRMISVAQVPPNWLRLRRRAPPKKLRALTFPFRRNRTESAMHLVGPRFRNLVDPPPDADRCAAEELVSA